MITPSTTVSAELYKHIREKIEYHENLRIHLEAQGKYEECISHRDEVARLKTLL